MHHPMSEMENVRAKAESGNQNRDVARITLLGDFIALQSLGHVPLDEIVEDPVG